jgi:hypothetical protein
MCESYNKFDMTTQTERSLIFLTPPEGLSSFKDQLVITERVAEDLRAGVQRYFETRNRMFLGSTPKESVFTLVPEISDAMLFDNLVARGYAPAHHQLLPEQTVIKLKKSGSTAAYSCSPLDSVMNYSQDAKEQFLETYERYKRNPDFQHNVGNLVRNIEASPPAGAIGFIGVSDYKSMGHTEFMTVVAAIHALELSKRIPGFNFGEFLDKHHQDLFPVEAKKRVYVVEMGNNVRLARVTLGEIFWIDAIIKDSFPELLHYREKTGSIVSELLHSILRGGYRMEDSSIKEIKTEEDINYVGWEISRPRPLAYKKETANPADIIQNYCQERGVDFSSLLMLHDELARKIRELGSNINF